MIDCLLATKDAVANGRAAHLQALPNTEKIALIVRHNRIVEEGYPENPRVQPPGLAKRRGPRKQSKALNLLEGRLASFKISNRIPEMAEALLRGDAKDAIFHGADSLLTLYPCTNSPQSFPKRCSGESLSPHCWRICH